MKAKDMILPEIPLLTPGMSVKQGLATMQMSGLSSLPIVDEDSYVGVVHEKELLRDDVAGKIGRENWRTPSVREEPFVRCRQSTCSILRRYTSGGNDRSPLCGRDIYSFGFGCGRSFVPNLLFGSDY